MFVKVIYNEKDKSWLIKKNCIKKKNIYRWDKKKYIEESDKN